MCVPACACVFPLLLIKFFVTHSPITFRYTGRVANKTSKRKKRVRAAAHRKKKKIRKFPYGLNIYFRKSGRDLGLSNVHIHTHTHSFLQLNAQCCYCCYCLCCLRIPTNTTTCERCYNISCKRTIKQVRDDYIDVSMQ